MNGSLGLKIFFVLAAAWGLYLNLRIVYIALKDYLQRYRGREMGKGMTPLKSTEWGGEK